MNTALVLLAACTIAQPADPLKLPTEVKGQPGKFITIKAATMGKQVRWRAVDPGLEILDDLPSLKESKEIRCIACKPGRYRVEAYTSINDEPTPIVVCTVVVGNAPPGPNPPPNPNPPNPNPPNPPIDPMVAKFSAALAADGGTTPVNRAQLIALIGLYEAAADHAAKPGITTVGMLLEDIRKVAYGEGGQSGLIRPDVLVGVRKAISAEVATVLGDEPSAQLDSATRARAVDMFRRVAVALAKLQG